MKELTLLEHLIKDFQEQKQLLKSQIDLIDPIATSIRKPVAARLFNNGLLVFLEVLMWVLLIGCIALLLFMDQIIPFSFLSRIGFDPDFSLKYERQEFVYFTWAVKGLIVLLGILFFWISRMLAKIRVKNTILNLAGRNMKQLVEQLLQRKAAMENLELKFPAALPSDSDSVIPPMNDDDHDDVLL